MTEEPGMFDMNPPTEPTQRHDGSYFYPVCIGGALVLSLFVQTPQESAATPTDQLCKQVG